MGAYREEGLDRELVLGEVCRGVGLVSMVPGVSEATVCLAFEASSCRRS